MIRFDFINIAVLMSLGIHAAIIAVLIQHGRKQVSGRAYLWSVASVAAWVVTMILYRGIAGAELLWVRVLYMAASFTSTTFFLFTLQFPENKKTAWFIKPLVWLENVAMLVFVAHPTLFIGGVQPVPGGEAIITFTPWYPVYVLHIAGFFSAGFLVLWQKYRHTTDRSTKRQIAVILGGYILPSTLAMTTNLVLPWFGHFELNWLGQVFSTFLAIFTTYAIVRHRFMNTKVITTQVFALILAFLMFIQLAFSVNARDFAIRVITFVGVVVIELLLIRSVMDEVHRREEMEKLTHELEEAYVKLKQVDQAKTDFLSLASHQLRSPLTVIKVGLGALLDGVFGQIRGIKQRDAMKKIIESADRLVNLIGEYLDISRIELGRMEYKFVSANMNTLVETLVKEYTQRAEAKGLKLTLAMDSKVPTLSFDEDKFRQVITNLLDNAIKYTPTGTVRVATAVAPVGGRTSVVVRVTDTGRGLSKEDMGLIFQKFKRASGKSMRMRDGEPVEGSGLGLYVAKMFVEAHKGTIWAESKGIGKGTTFAFSIPLAT